MSFEAPEEQRLERQVDAIFEDVAGMTVRERMGIVALDLSAQIKEERLAQDDVQKEWFERDKDANKTPRKSHLSFGKTVLEGFAGLPNAVPWGAYVSPPVYNNKVISPEEIPDEPPVVLTPIERARGQISMAKEVLLEIYGLTPRQIKKAEKKARSLHD